MVISDLSEQLLKLQLSSASLARKQHNYNLAQRLLTEQAAFLMENHTEANLTYDLDMLKVAIKQLRDLNTVSNLDTLRIERESAKLIHCVGRYWFTY